MLRVNRFLLLSFETKILRIKISVCVGVGVWVCMPPQAGLEMKNVRRNFSLGILELC